MSAEEKNEGQEDTTLTEGRRQRLLQRQNSLMSALLDVQKELSQFSVAVSQSEIQQVMESLDYRGMVLSLEVYDKDESTDKQPLCLYNPKTGRVHDVAPHVDAILEAALQHLLDKGEFKSPVQMTKYSDTMACYVIIDSPYHGMKIADDSIVISREPLKGDRGEETALAAVVDGEIHHSKDLGTRGKLIDRLIVEDLKKRNISLSDLEHHYLILKDGDRLATYVDSYRQALEKKVKGDAAKKPEKLLEKTTEAEANHIAKVGPNGRIRYRQSTSQLKDFLDKRNVDVRDVMTEVSDIALERVDESDFVYLVLKKEL